MNYYHIYQIFLGLLLMMTLISGRTLYYDQLDEGDKMKLSSSEDEEVQDFDSKLSNMVNGGNDIDDSNESYDSYEEKQFHQRGLFSSSHASHTISAHTRQAIIDILQKAFDQGWRPHLKHYIPATRFGRHRR